MLTDVFMWITDKKKAKQVSQKNNIIKALASVIYIYNFLEN